MFPPTEPTAQFPYQIQEKIGEGAMGEVYRATEPSLGRTVAIKVLKSTFLENLGNTKVHEIRQRFIQEAQAAARLSHPGTTTIFRVGLDSEHPYIAMEWIDGSTLEDILETQGPLAADRVAKIGIALLETLDAAHKAGIVHRDIKPANIMVTLDNRVKIADFGVARMRGSTLVETQAGTILGTPLYASPEQLHGHDVDGRADVYAVGVVLYEALTAEMPYDAPNVVALVQQILSPNPPPSPQKYNASLSDGFAQVILKSIEPRRESRYDSAATMAQMLAPFVHNDSALAGVSSIALDQTVMSLDNLTGILAAAYVVPGADKTQLVASLIQGWPSQSMGEQPVLALLDKLMERPLHTPAFCGAVQVGSVFFLLQNGLIYAVFDPLTFQVSDALYEKLPQIAAVTLFHLPESFPINTVVFLASMLQPPKVRHGNLDASYVAIPQMVEKLVQDKFSGAVKFQSGSSLAFLLIEQGQPLLHLFSADWGYDPTVEPWPHWIFQANVIASIEEQRVVLSSISYRRELKDYRFDVRAIPVTRETIEQNIDLRRSSSISVDSLVASGYEVTPDNDASARLAGSALTQIYMSDPLYAFLHWMGRDMPVFFAKRERVKRWKYLVEWINLVRCAQLYHNLPRPKSTIEDQFDMVTYDETGKVLHLISRYSDGSAAAMQSFIDRVIEAKTARIKTGDVGGACFIAPNISEEALALYDQLTSEQEKKKRFFFSLQDSLTGYEGFIRMGARRGFHLLLVAEREDGFHPILPAG